MPALPVKQGLTDLGLLPTPKGTIVRVTVENRPLAYRITAWIDSREVGSVGVYRGTQLPPKNPDPHTPSYQVRSADVPEGLRRQGIATLLYQVAADVAEAEGFALASDVPSSLSLDANAFWEKQYNAGRAYWEVPGPIGLYDEHFEWGRWVLYRPARLT